MNSNALIWIGLTVGSTLGSFVPALWGGGFLSVSSVMWSAVGGLLGIYAGYRLNNR